MKQGTSMRQVPLVFQYNKQDLPTALDISQMDQILNGNGSPSFGHGGIDRAGALGSVGRYIQSVCPLLR